MQSIASSIADRSQREPRSTTIALVAYNRDYDEATLDYGADVTMNERQDRKILDEGEGMLISKVVPQENV